MPARDDGNALLAEVMMATRMFALIAGIIYLALGVMAFFQMFTWPPSRPHLLMSDLRFHGAYLGGFLATNLPHNIFWILFGAGGILSSLTFATARRYGQALFAISTAFVLWGLLPVGIGDLFGYLPLSGWNVMIHTVTAICAWYYGCVYPIDVELQLTA